MQDKLPTEILGDIFQLSIPRISIKAFENGDLSSVFDEGEPHPNKMRWKISTICRNWKAILEATPVAWSTIVLECLGSFKVILRKCFELSRQLPLDIVAQGPDPEDDERGYALDLLKSHSRRIRRFHGTMNWDGFAVSAVIALFPSKSQRIELPLLTDLAIKDRSTYISPLKHSLDFPRLTRLSLWAFNMTVIGGLDFRSIQTLESLALTYNWYSPESETLLRLAECTSLYRLIITLDTIRDFPIWDPRQTIPIPSLKYIHFDIDREVVVSTFMSFLHLPSLTHISIRHGSNPHYGRVLIGAFESMRTVSLPALTTITLENIELVGSEFEDQASWIRQIDKICFKNCESNPGHFLGWCSPRMIISAPQVSRIVWEGGSNLYDFISFVAARMHQAERGEARLLENVKVIMPISPNDKEVEAVRQSVEKKWPNLLQCP